MRRLRFNDFLLSEGPQLVGLDKSDLPRCAAIANRADERLLTDRAMGDEGPVGAFAEMAFSVSRENPFITCPRGVARLEAIDICQRPVPLHNQFFEYLEFGNGRMPKMDRWGRCHWGHAAGYERNFACTMTDISNPPQQIQIFPKDQADTIPNPKTGAIPRVLLQGLDENGAIVTSIDGNCPVPVQGEFVTLAWPYALSVNSYSTLTGVQKDFTQGAVELWQSDPIWGMADILSTMEPTETTGWYRRYYINNVPRSCCSSFRPIIVNKQPPSCDCPHPKKEWVMVTAIAKLDLVPVVVPTDYFVIQSLEALISECQSIRMSRMDDTASAQKSADYHQKAIKLLLGQCQHVYGKNTPASNFAPFGRYGWERVNLGMI